jgi:hypothetical protein
MKKLLLTLAIIVLPLMGYGQDYEKLFKEADSLLCWVVSPYNYGDTVEWRMGAGYYESWYVDSVSKTKDGPILWQDDKILATYVPPPPNKIITLQDLIDYQEYCYNDSTTEWKTIYGTVTEKINEHVSFVSDDIDYRKVTIHRTPTFNGFIEWLKNKEK